MQNLVNRIFTLFVKYRYTFEWFRLTRGKGDEVGTIHTVVNAIGGHPENVGNGVMQMSTEGVNKIADTDMLQLGNAEWPFCPTNTIFNIVVEVSHCINNTVL